MAFPGGSVGRDSPSVWETWVQSLGWEVPLKKRMATHSNILVWRTPCKEEPGQLQSMGSQRVGHDWVTKHTAQRKHYVLMVLLMSSNKLSRNLLFQFNMHYIRERYRGTPPTSFSETKYKLVLVPVKDNIKRYKLISIMKTIMGKTPIKSNNS